MIGQSDEFPGGPGLNDDDDSDDESDFKNVKTFHDNQSQDRHGVKPTIDPGILGRRWQEIMDRLDKAEEERAEILTLLRTMRMMVNSPSGGNPKRRATISDYPSSSSSDTTESERGVNRRQVSNKRDLNMVHTGLRHGPVSELDDIEFEDGFSEDGSPLVDFGEEHLKELDV